MTWKPPESRKVTPRDVVEAFIRNTERPDCIQELAATCVALSECLEAVIAQLPAKTQLAIISARVGKPITYEGYHQVELTE